MPPTATQLSRRLLIPFFLLACLASGSAFAADDSGQWVRVHHGSNLPTLHSGVLGERLTDYGSFQWGRLTSKQIEQLRAAGLSVTAEDNPFELTLGGRRFDPLASPAPANARSADPSGDFYLIQFDGPVRKEWLQQVRREGVEIVQPLHPFSYIVWAESRRMTTAGTLPPVRWSGLMQVDWKLPPGQRFDEAGVVPTMALASAHVDRGRLSEQLAEFGRIERFTRLNEHLQVLHLEVDRRDYRNIAALPGIYTIQYIRPETGPRGEMSQQSIVGAIDGAGDVLPGYSTWLNDTGYDGSGITVGVVDGRVLSTHVDLADRMAPCNGTNGSCGGSGSNAHGTHVAGAIAGTGATGTRLNGFLRGQGVAPGASIVSQVYDPFTDSSSDGMVADGMLQIFQDSARSGALLTNNSWGPSGSPQGYDIPTMQVDYISRDADPDTPGDQPVLAVWSIMNGYGDSAGSCAPSSLGAPDEAKNLFAVGSTALQTNSGDQVANIFRVSSNSGHGPACDGRRVPHIVAPGCSTDSTTNASNTAHAVATFCGTSMASPVVSGAVSVWAEKYIDENGVAPSPALTKAVFTAAARNLEGNPNANGGTMGHRPDRFQGYGRLDLDAVVNPVAEVFLHDQSHVFDATGQEWTAVFEPADPDQPVRVMLAWTDAPGAGLGGNSEAWVNNLDLSVGADGQTYFGNVIGADGWSAPGGSADAMNNLEGVFLSPAQTPDSFSITVSAADLLGDALAPYNPGNPSQDFALACYNCLQTDATFSLSTSSPGTLQICAPESGSNQYQAVLDIDPVGPYSGQVALTTSGLPSGTTASFSPESVTVPGSATWTLDVGSTTPDGFYIATLGGDDGERQQGVDLYLDIDAYLDTAPTPLTPEEGREARSLTPQFTWEGLPGVSRYRVQIATDPGFNSVVSDGIINGTSYTPSVSLDTSTAYFWRVQGNNLCGGGVWSEPRGFQTIMFTDRFENASSN
jgi:hypothetical protein